MGAVQFSDGALYRPQVIEITRTDGMTAEEIAYVQLNNTAIANTVTAQTAIFDGKILATPPSNFGVLSKKDFEVYINGRLVPSTQVNSITQGTSPVSILVTIDVEAFTEGSVTLFDGDEEIVLVGKFK